MLQLGGKEFARACQAQDVGLNDRLAEALNSPGSLDDGTPTRLLNTLYAAASALMGSPGEPLATRRNLAMTPSMRIDPVAVHLARIINFSCHPLENPGLPSFASTNEFLAICPEAEYHFLDTFDSIANARSTGETDKACQLIIDEDGPLMIRKNIGQPTALTLKPIAVDGIPFPAGMIASVRLNGRTSNYESKERVNVIEISDVSAVGPLRLSAFGLGRFRRSIDFFSMYPYQRDDKKVFRNPDYMKIRLSDIGQIASSFLAAERHSPIRPEAKFA